MPVNPERRLRFEELFATHHAAVRSYVVRRGGGEVGLDDAVADTFVVAWRRLDDVPEPALPWLLGVARRVLADQRRAARRRRSLGERLRTVTATAPPVGDWEPPTGLTAELARALAAMTEHERRRARRRVASALSLDATSVPRTTTERLR